MFNTKEKLIKSVINDTDYREISDEKLKLLQECLLEMYKDVWEVCEQNSICVMLSGGTALGAVRHGGFIPWDDDLDLMIPRNDYNKFLKVFETTLGHKYNVIAPNFNEGSQIFFGRIYKKNTTKVSITNIGTTYPKGIFIDIFPIDFAPQKRLLQIFKGFYIDSIRFIGVSVFHFLQKNRKLKKIMKKENATNIAYNFRLFLGFIFSFYSTEKWFNIYDRLSRGKKSDYITIACGRKRYVGEILPLEVFFPSRKYIFENVNAIVPNNVEEYLRNLYGNYKIIPPIEEREKHPIFMLDFEKEYNA